MSRPLLPPRGVFSPTRIIYHPRLSPGVIHTWSQLRGLAWGKNASPPLRLEELVELTHKSKASLHRHLNQLMKINALSWRKTEDGRIILVFPEEPGSWTDHSNQPPRGPRQTYRRIDNRMSPPPIPNFEDSETVDADYSHSVAPNRVNEDEGELTSPRAASDKKPSSSSLKNETDSTEDIGLLPNLKNETDSTEDIGLMPNLKNETDSLEANDSSVKIETGTVPETAMSPKNGTTFIDETGPYLKNETDFKNDTESRLKIETNFEIEPESRLKIETSFFQNCDSVNLIKHESLNHDSDQINDLNINIDSDHLMINDSFNQDINQNLKLNLNDLESDQQILNINDQESDHKNILNNKNQESDESILIKSKDQDLNINQNDQININQEDHSRMNLNLGGEGELERERGKMDKNVQRSTFNVERYCVSPHTPARVYQSITGLALDPYRASVIRQRIDDLDAWRDTVKHWVWHGWNSKNLNGMLDLYSHGGANGCVSCGSKILQEIGG